MYKHGRRVRLARASAEGGAEDDEGRLPHGGKFGRLGAPEAAAAQQPQWIINVLYGQLAW